MLLQIQQIFVVITSEAYLVILNNLVNFFRNRDLFTEIQKEQISLNTESQREMLL